MKNKDNLYIIRMFGRDGNSILKMGYSGCMPNRIKSYKAHNPLIEIVGTFYREDAIEFERVFHNCNPAILRREFYNESELDNIICSIKNKSIEEIQLISENKPIRYEDLVNYFKSFPDCEKCNIDWKDFSLRKDWIDVIEKCWELYGKLWVDIYVAKEMIKNYVDEVGKIGVQIRNMFEVGKRYNRSEIKEKLNLLYLQENIVKKGKHSDLYKYFEIKESASNGNRFLKILSIR